MNLCLDHFVSCQLGDQILDDHGWTWTVIGRENPGRRPILIDHADRSVRTCFSLLNEYCESSSSESVESEFDSSSKSKCYISDPSPILRLERDSGHMIRICMRMEGKRGYIVFACDSPLGGHLVTFITDRSQVELLSRV